MRGNQWRQAVFNHGESDEETHDLASKYITHKRLYKKKLVKYAGQVSRRCFLDILVVIRDPETKQIIEYSSGNGVS